MDYKQAKTQKEGTKLKFDNKIVIVQGQFNNYDFLYEDGSVVKVNPNTVKIEEITAVVTKKKEAPVAIKKAVIKKNSKKK
tara:strand:- start:7021 stop:7260 length:240 start_codon:yes stop_codon:yes gene_type:complete